jgi:hypothetical protein
MRCVASTRERKKVTWKPKLRPPASRVAGDVPPLGAALALVPVLRLTTCVDVASEAMLHHRYGSTNSRSTTLRQGAAQLIFRYQPPTGRAFDFHFPAGNATTALGEVNDPERPGRIVMGHFQRQAQAEAAALRTLFGELELRPWSLSAGVAMDRLTRLSSARLQSSVLPVGVEGNPMMLVPQRRERWPELLAHHIPDLQSRGWAVEVVDDFPFELHTPDDWSVDIGEEPGGNWFSVGLQVKVDGQPVNLVPLLVSLVQSGWLKLDAAMSQDDNGDVLVPWAGDVPAAPGTAPRQRLLRLPVKRVAPLMDWLRSVFRVGDKAGALRLSRFDLGTLEALSADVQVKAPPSFTELMTQVRLLGSGKSLPEVAVSPKVQATLRHYQLDGLAWMDFLRRARLGGILADDMGLGKTAQALAHIWAEKQAGRLDRPALVIMPTSLLFNWQQEAARVAPGLAVRTWHGADRATVDLVGADVVLSTYNLVWRDLRTLAAQPWHLLIIDEAQAVKNAQARAARALRRLDTRHRLALTGTPLENHLGELWSLFDLLMPGFLGDSRTFARHWRKPIEINRDGARARLLAARVRPFILRRMKGEVATELPPLTELVKRVTLVGQQKQLYESVRVAADHMIRRILARDGFNATSLISVLDAMLKLRQVCCDPLLLKGVDMPSGVERAKLEWLREHLPDFVAQGRRLLVFSQFTEMLDADCR